MTSESTHRNLEAYSVYDRLMDVLFYLTPVEDIHEIVHPQFIGYGTALHEFCSTREELASVARLQQDQLRSQKFSVTRKPVVDKYLASEHVYIVIEEFIFHLEEIDHDVMIRLTSILERTDGRWWITHVHGSTPDSDIDTVEALPGEGLRKKNAELEARILARTRDLEIEAALERTRAQSMAMQHSSELNDISKIFHEQLQSLGIDTEFSYVWLPNEEAGNHLFWATWSEKENNGEIQTSAITYPLDKTEPYTAACFADWTSGIPIHEHFVKPADIKDFFGSWEDLVKGASHLRSDNFPDGIFYTEAFMKYGCFGINIRREITNEEKSILHRFAIEFERAYTRFLDLKKAEAQARETEIELSLERVRASSMAMHESNQLADVATVMFREVNELVDDLWTCGIVLCEEDSEEDVWWLSIENGFLPPLPLPNVGDRVHNTLYRAWVEGKSYETVQIEGEELEQHYAWLMDIPASRKVFEDMQEAGMERPVWQKLHGAYFSKGYLVFITEVPCPEHEIFKRFAQVFDLTYTRFLDLKKAEAQAREAQVEAALERVRARTMAMQHSDELSETSYMLDQEVRKLGMKTWGCAFNIYRENDSIEWFGNEAGLLPTYTVPRVGIFKEYFDLGQSGETLYTKEIAGAECVAHYEFMSTLPVLGDILMQLKETNGAFPTYQIDHVAYFKYGYLLFITTEPVPESHEIFKRFANVFEQTYTRFLDLQKAEAQARESQIEIALERVRNKAMSMRKSHELADLVITVFQELSALDMVLTRCLIWIFNEEDLSATAWMANSEDPNVADSYAVPYHEHPAYANYLDSWKSQESKWEYVLEGENKDTWDDILVYGYFGRLPEAIKKAMKEPDRIILSGSFNKYGLIQTASMETLSDENLEIVVRFSQVFEQSYTRFLDLQEVEKRAREANIEAALERVRARALAMQEPEELTDVADVLRNEMARLNIETLASASVYIIDKAKDQIECWLPVAQKSGDAKWQNRTFRTDLGSTWFARTLNSFHSGDAARVTLEMSGDALSEWAEHFEQSQLPSENHLKYNLVKFSDGALGAIDSDSFSEEDWQLFGRAASVLALAYSRFKDLTQSRLDLQRLKEEKKRAEEALAELKLTQDQLVHAEKMASLGELTAGIAHEIKNPLNFVNNFSEVSRELLDEMREELNSGNVSEVNELVDFVSQNLDKIVTHGQRADAIVKSMLQHSRTGDGEKQPTDINALADEYVRLAYHGLRAKDKSFNATIETTFDDRIGEVNVVPQDIGRVLLNLLTNAFHAVQERQHAAADDYKPSVLLETIGRGDAVEIVVKDNGKGMPPDVMKKIFQPFFTTKPTGQGTGLGLSMSYDIVTKGHGGQLSVVSEEGEGTTFTVILPNIKDTPQQ